MELPSRRRLMGGVAFMTLLGFVGYYGQGRVHIGGVNRQATLHSNSAKGRKTSIPKKSEVASNASDDNSAPDANKKPTKSSAHKAAPTQPLKLNVASAEELQAIPGIGPSISARIIDYRNAHGPFHSLDDLLDVKGIGDKLFDKISPYLTL